MSVLPSVQARLHLMLQPTPLVQLEAFPGVWMKCEHLHPTGSHKDRAYAYMVEALGHDIRERVLVDYTTGNGGISLAHIGGQLGNEVHIFMPSGTTYQREARIHALGAHLHLTPRKDFVRGAKAAAEEYCGSHPRAILLDQSVNPLNRRAFELAGRELVTQLQDERVVPTAWVCVIGTGGTYSGFADALKSQFRGLRGIGVEDRATAAVFARMTGNHDFSPGVPSVLGAGAGFVAPNTDETLIDEVLCTSASELAPVMSLLASAGIDVGPSTAANIHAAAIAVRRLGSPVITVSFDSADRY